jgi:hypothetical protein
MMRYWLAFVLWIALTYGCFALSAAWIGRRYSLPFALSHPSVVTNFLIGQNGFLTASIFMLGSKLLGNAPLLAGAVFGLLIIKPQLAVLLPFAFVAGREWKAFAGAALSSISALLLAALVLGTEAYRGFFAILPVYAHGFAANLWPWNEVASPFAFFRFIGVPQVPALIGHGIIAAVAIAVTCRAWWLRHDNRIPVLAAATMLVIPYLMTYDCLFLAAPMMTLDAEQRRPHLVALIWLCCFLPVMGHFGWYHGPNTIPFASLLSLWGLLSKPASESGVANGSSALPA